MLTPADKQNITLLLDAAEERLKMAASSPIVEGRMPALALEATNLLAQVDAMLLAPEVILEDPLYYAAGVKRIYEMWAAYVRSTNLCGLGECACLVAR